MRKLAFFCLIFSVVFFLSGLQAAEPEEPPKPAVEIRGDWFYVNGEKFLVKGIGYSPYRPHELPWKNTVPLERMEKDFERIRAAGFNTLRTWTPLSREALQLAHRYNLMVIQGISLNHNTHYDSESYLRYSVDKVTRAVAQFKEEPNVLLVLVTNEPPVASVSRSGKKAAENYLRQIVAAAKKEAPHLPVSFSNWTQLAFLDTSFLDCVANNVYMNKPVTIQHTSGYLPFLQWLKRTHARGKPLVVTEFGLAVNPTGEGHFSEGGNLPEDQAKALLRMWSQILASGAAGGCVFEWNDEWWKNYEKPGDEHKHDDEPEEWYGIIDVDQDPLGKPRPAYEALKKFNTAVLLSPHRYEDYSGAVSFQVNAVDVVDKIKMKVGAKGGWQKLSKIGDGWWEGAWPAPAGTSGKIEYTLQALNQKGKVLVDKRDFFFLKKEKEAVQPLRLEIKTEPGDSEVQLQDGGWTDVRVIFKLTDAAGQPVAGRRIYFSIYETLFEQELKGHRMSDANGEVRCSYVVQQPGFLVLCGSTGYFSGDRVGRVCEVKYLELVKGAAKVARAVEAAGADLPIPAFHLAEPGKEFPVDYAKHGEWKGVGTKDYQYVIKDMEGLSAAVGTGIYPNEVSVYREPLYKKYESEGKLEGYHWDFVAEEDTAASFFKWVIAPEDPFVKVFYCAAALQRGNLLQHALKAFNAVLVHAPDGVGWTYFGTPWSLGKTAMDRIDWITRAYPQLEWRLDGARVEIENGFDNDPLNDRVLCDPGKWVRCEPSEVVPPRRELKTAQIVKTLGGERTKLVQYASGDWQLLVDGKPFIVQGITYGPIKVGQSHHEGSVEDWMTQDRDGNGKPDGPYDSWVDANRNNEQDPDEKIVGDLALLKEMGVNTLRLYHHASNKQLLRDMFAQYGIRVMMGDLLGMYNVGSGASWEEGTDYRNPQQRANMMESVRQMVLEHKDEPYVLFWVLGNENNYGGVHGEVGGKGNASVYPDVYYGFANEVAKMIKSLDPTRPVAICNGDLFLLDKVAQYAPDVDIYGTNSYRGSYGFGKSLWTDIKRIYDKPVFISEYGCPAFYPGKSQEEAEAAQAEYNKHAWEDILYNSGGLGAGNSIGGILFQFMDEWWKAGQPPTFSPYIHETVGQFPGPFPAGWFYEEWFGVCSQGNGKHSPFLRQLRKTYFVYQELWKK